MIAEVTHNEVLDAALIGAVGAVVAAGVSAMALVMSRRTRAEVLENRTAISERLDSLDGHEEFALLIDAHKQHSRRLDHIADRADRASDQLAIVQAMQHEKAQRLDEIAGQLNVVDERLSEHIEWAQEQLEGTRPLADFIRELMGKGGT